MALSSRDDESIRSRRDLPFAVGHSARDTKSTTVVHVIGRDAGQGGWVPNGTGRAALNTRTSLASDSASATGIGRLACVSEASAVLDVVRSIGQDAGGTRGGRNVSSCARADSALAIDASAIRSKVERSTPAACETLESRSHSPKSVLNRALDAETATVVIAVGRHATLSDRVPGVTRIASSHALSSLAECGATVGVIGRANEWRRSTVVDIGVCIGRYANAILEVVTGLAAGGLALPVHALGCDRARQVARLSALSTIVDIIRDVTAESERVPVPSVVAKADTLAEHTRGPSGSVLEGLGALDTVAAAIVRVCVVLNGFANTIEELETGVALGGDTLAIDAAA